MYSEQLTVYHYFFAALNFMAFSISHSLTKQAKKNILKSRPICAIPIFSLFLCSFVTLIFSLCFSVLFLQIYVSLCLYLDGSVPPCFTISFPCLFLPLLSPSIVFPFFSQLFQHYGNIFFVVNKLKPFLLSVYLFYVAFAHFPCLTIIPEGDKTSNEIKHSWQSIKTFTTRILIIAKIFVGRKRFGHLWNLWHLKLPFVWPVDLQLRTPFPFKHLNVFLFYFIYYFSGQKSSRKLTLLWKTVMDQSHFCSP